MESMGNAITQPFQGDRSAENILKLAAVLAPRLNFGNRPLQQGEGEGLRQLLSAFGGFAEQSRRQKSEGQVMTGLQDALTGKVPWSSLPVSDLPEATQRMIMEEMGKGIQRQNPSVTDRLAAITHASQIAQQGGDPREAFGSLGVSSLFSGGGAPSAQPLPPAVTGAVSMRSGEDLAPSLNTLPQSSSSPFGLTKWEAERRMPPKTLGEIEARAVEEMSLPPEGRLQTVRRQHETPVTLEGHLKDAMAQYDKTRDNVLGGGKNILGDFLLEKTASKQDYIELMRDADRAQSIEGRLAAEQGREAQELFIGLLPSRAELQQVHDARSKKLRNRKATYQETIDEWVQLLVDRAKAAAEAKRNATAQGAR